MTNRFGRAAVLLLITGLSSLLLATAAHAEDPHRGWGIVMSRDLAASTLEIGDRVYRVTPQTVFENRDGTATSFEALDVFDVHQGLFRVDDATKVEYVSVQTSGGAVLRSVKVVDELPF